ncbi:MAG: 50S ribosomal protein L37e [Candidatus Rehaiarchaeum fermentans]|nr:50S ribosomal protein L37e [Candidatus Rehaiarchaeum fermentans]MCW1292561.1 50S ribosomal protein L37e [Candidatus Rehaiarchaeum fermentans]MCW1293222.1 50S ribosomal protein L37e [Candidatus Rehaiarchaeum fermentans]MCW1297406.1 50S ribosomal protein L37e [Candidatus Rehaiarchaeum fermentans]MCW1302463.1 50S ribosomal protein L37e [Candidatus Rehaiarchaeum fermentans]
MGKANQGVHNRGPRHVMCRRCGHQSYNVRYHYCSYCGYGKTSKIKHYSWKTKNKGIRVK